MKDTHQRRDPVQHPVQAVDTTTPQYQSQPQQGDNDQQTLRKDMAIIHTKNSPLTKNIGLTHSTQGYSHIKTPIQDQNR